MSVGGQGNLVGIDLGTTMSVIAHLDAKGSVTTIPNTEGSPLTPSIVYLDGDSAIVGERARKAKSEKVANFMKRDMGKRFYSRLVDGRQFRPETLSAIVLRKLKQDAERRIGPISKAVITVPAFFDELRRKATHDAGRIAGLEVLDIINEPTAAALAYALESQETKVGAAYGIQFPTGQMTVLVYDLGGGTFDVTVVRLAAKQFSTLATDGAVELGGKDWDEKIMAYVAEEFRKRFGANPLDDTKARDALAVSAEETKKLLSTLSSADIEYSYRGNMLEGALSRTQFEEMTRDKLAESQIVTELVIKQAQLDWNQIDRVLLVGGSTRMPMVKEMLRKVTGKAPDESLDPDQVVARGAAIHAGIRVASAEGIELEIDDDIRDHLKDVTVNNVNAYSLGIRALRGGKPVNEVLIPKNSQLPRAASKIFRLHEPSSSGAPVSVRILEGEAADAAHNVQIGECRITGLPRNLPAKAPVQVRLGYAENGLVSVMALDMTSGHYAQAEIQRESGLSEADIEREAAFVSSLKIH